MKTTVMIAAVLARRCCDWVPSNEETFVATRVKDICSVFYMPANEFRAPTMMVIEPFDLPNAV